MIGVMLVLQDDDLAMANLARYILDDNPDDSEIMIWLGRYIKKYYHKHKK